jgi:hypothetical protein
MVAGLEMKIISRKEFLELPAGVLFQKGHPWYWEIPLFKGDTIYHEGKAIDFHTQSLFDTDPDEHTNVINAWEDMLNNKKEYPAESVGERDGCFDDEDLFMIYDEKDRKYIANLLLYGKYELAR